MMPRCLIAALTTIAALGASPVLGLEYKVLPNPQGDGPSLLVEGKFERGDDINKFRQVLDRYKPVTVQLQSPGGNILSAVEHGREIRRRALNTYVPKGGICASACSLTFMGGVIRLAAEGTIGVHQAFYPDNKLGADEQVKDIQFLTADIVAYMTEMGVSASLLALTLSKAPEEMHFLSLPEMVEHKVTNIAPIIVETQRRLLKQKEGETTPVEQDKTVRTSIAPAVTRVPSLRRLGPGLPVAKTLPIAGTRFTPPPYDQVPYNQIQPTDPDMPMLTRLELEANGRKLLFGFIEAIQNGPRGRRWINSHMHENVWYNGAGGTVAKVQIIAELADLQNNVSQRHLAIVPGTISSQCDSSTCVAKTDIGNVVVHPNGVYTSVLGRLAIAWHPAGRINRLAVEQDQSQPAARNRATYINKAAFEHGIPCRALPADICDQHKKVGARMSAAGWVIKGVGSNRQWVWSNRRNTVQRTNPTRRIFQGDPRTGTDSWRVGDR